MDLRDTPEEAAFRAELRAWLEENLPDGLQGHRGGATRFEGPEMRAWSRALYEAGYIGLTWPEEYGGGGAPYTHQAIFLEELARAEAPPHIGVIGIGMAGPTIIAHGTEEQKARYLAPLLAAEEIWCQGFSEPGAGSDLAGVRTSALPEDGHFVVNGQKVWSSFAHIADFCILLTRSDPESTRHAGLSYLIVDMHAPGVEVRPLRQITGEAEFNEIFFNDVRVPAENLLGEIGGGWQVAMTTLLHERGTLGFALQAALEVQIRKLVALAARSWRRPPPARSHRTRVDRDAGRALHELPLALGAHEDGDARPGGLHLEARVVGGEPASDEARTRDPRPGRGARRGQRAVRRLLAVPAAQKPRQHHRGGHLGGAPQHRRRARARPSLLELGAMDFTFTPEQDALREQAREFLAATPEPTWAQLAELGWTGVSIAEEDGGAGLSFLEESVLFEELGRALYRGPYFATIGLTLPALPAEERAAVAAGETSWTLALGPLVPDLDSAERIAIVGGDGIYELEGGEREILATTDETRTLGVVRGGEPGRRLADSSVLAEIEARSQTALALEACGVARLALEDALEYASSREQFGKKIGVYQAVSHPLADAYTRVELSRSLALWATWCVATGDPQAAIAAAAAKSYAGESAVWVCEAAIQSLGGIGFTWEHRLHRLYKRALGIESFGPSGTRLRAEIAASLIEREKASSASPAPVTVTQGG